MNKPHSHEYECQDGRDFQQHHHVVGFGGLANAADQYHRQEHHDDKSGNIEAHVKAGGIERPALEIGEAAGKIRGRDPAQRRMPAKPVEGGRHVCGEANADGHVADRIFQDQVPSDDPGDQLAHGRVGVGVSAAGNGNHGRQLGIAQPGEAAHDCDQHQGQCDAPGRRRVVPGWPSDARCSRREER